MIKTDKKLTLQIWYGQSVRDSDRINTRISKTAIYIEKENVCKKIILDENVG